MMMLREPHRANPTVHVPPWPMMNDSTAEIFSPLTANAEYSPHSLQEALSALQQYVPSNETEFDADSDAEDAVPSHESVDVYSCDHFRMFEFKIRRCARGRSHDWTECPFAHPGEKARRRDPRKFHYSGAACPDFRKGSCKKGDACEFAHGVFECWLHPARYRTQPCKDGTSCRRRVCFFAHTPEQRRVLTQQQSPRSGNSSSSLYDGSPLRLAIESSSSSSSSPPVDEMVVSLRNLQLGKMKSLPSSWNVPIGSPRFGSPRGHVIRPGFCSLPTTPTTQVVRGGGGGVNYFGMCEEEEEEEEEAVMERVESGRDIRAKMFEKLSKENSLDRSVDGAPDVGWVSELVTPPYFS